ncbi:8-amino-7-oxononanoate synthase [Vibrionales bacterium C3R12]|nr:8-amino-7-oxononanoate synthase [Vibrionales bacterium C3R12]
MMPAFSSRIKSALEQRSNQGLTRVLQPISSGNQTRFMHDGKPFINFSNNDYLGLAGDPELIRAWKEGLDQFGAGSGASPLVTGFSSAHQNLESKLCEWLGFERAILFNSGFSANQALIFSLLDKQDILIQDKLNHASLMEAGMLSAASLKRFRHNDTEHLSSILAASDSALVVTEGVFSMDGDTASLKPIKTLCEQNNAWLAVDDAHGIGIHGENGAGSCSQVDVKPDLLVVTFGKAVGLSGAAILCSADVGDYLTQFARHHVYSTALPPAQAHAISHAISMIQSQQWRRDKLSDLQELYSERLAGLAGFTETITPIKPFICGSSDQAVGIANGLKDKGLWVTAIRPPTVPNGLARLRITLTAKHTNSDILALAEAITAAVEIQNQ